MHSIALRAGHWPIALILATLCACADGPSAPMPSPERDRAATQSINITKVEFSISSTARTADPSATPEAASTQQDRRK
jgi:hypothetical protein